MNPGTDIGLKMDSSTEMNSPNMSGAPSKALPLSPERRSDIASATILPDEDAAPLPREQSHRSPFLYTPPTADADTLAILHLKRDSLIPITLRSTADDGYAEGAVTNTRFGSFPHSTLIGLEWGSQVRASKVDTGTRGRKGKQKQETKDNGMPVEEISKDGVSKKKRKSDETQHDDHDAPTKKLKQQPSEPQASEQVSSPKVAIEAGSGFVHILPPTPESWTSSLDHRTQVVYTPDYSHILQRLRVRPGDTIIEAGAGSGSFTHAAARAVFNGYSDSSKQSRRLGKIYSYEYHAPRVKTLQTELTSHGLDSVVSLTHRDVCNDGFVLPDPQSQPKATAIFLDLPAPWLALRHLTRSTSPTPLDPNQAIHLCTFSPCIEQVMATISHLRKNNWTEITTHEIQHRRLDVRRERVGLKEEGLRGVNASAATVEEAISRLREVESKLSDFHANKEKNNGGGEKKQAISSKQQRLDQIKREAQSRQLYKEGNLVMRTEPEIKTHTSYLVFGVLPREWSESDERGCVEKWPVAELMKSGTKDSTNGKA